MGELYERCSLKHSAGDYQWDVCMDETIKTCGNIKKDIILCDKLGNCNPALISTLTKLYDTDCKL